MSDVAIRVDGLGKEYRLGAPRERYHTLGDQIRKWISLRRMVRRAEPRPPFWALKDVSFEVRRGEVVGIIGRNGAGKSTLLKILSRITEPTEGGADIHGRVGSLLEVGTGFHPELTGRENIFLNGAILGMRRAEIVRKFDEIVAFAEVEKFIDTPVKHYSSGMYTRLAFAVAAHLEPDILVVDEVLAVGDAQFQKKCLGKMGEVARGGRTVLFVSHNMSAVQTLCSRALRLRQGQVVGNGRAAEIVREHLESDSECCTSQVWNDPSFAPQNEYIRLVEVRVRPLGNVLPGALSVHDPVDLEFEYDVLKPGLRLNLSIHVHTQDEVCAFNTTSFKEAKWDGRSFPTGRFRTTCHIPADLLNNGRYRVSVMFVRDTTVAIFQVAGALEFDVADSPADRGDWYGKWPGVVRPRIAWETRLTTSPELD